MEKPDISVVVPVYNAENVIEKCVKSLFQNKCKVEVILVNDGSKDSSKEKCEALKIQYGQRLVVIHKENGGVSSARNVGIKVANAEIITFADADDFYNVNAMDMICEQFQKTKSDMVIWNYSIVFPKGQKECNTWFEDSAVVTVEQLKNHYWKYVDAGMFNPVWNKAFKKSVVNQFSISFCRDITFSEDALFNIDYLKHCDRVGYIEYPLYNYVINDESATQRKHPDFYRMLDYTFDCIEDFLGKSIENQYQWHYHEWFSVIKQTIYHQSNKVPNKKVIMNNERTKKMFSIVKAVNKREVFELEMMRRGLLTQLGILYNIKDILRKVKGKTK